MGFSIWEFFKYVFLGLIQGITEVLPISSSGHVELMKALLRIDMDQGVLFLIILNTGSLVTFLCIYHKKLFELIKSFFVYVFYKEKRSENHENTIFLIKILSACIPAGIAGLFLKPILNEYMIKYDILLAGVGLLITATVIYLISNIKFRRGNTEFSWLDTLFIGLSQAVALFPGISRSGMTTSTALKRGSSITSALNFSFLMYIFISIATTGVLILEFFEVESTQFTGVDLAYYFGAFIAAAVATFFAYKLIFNIFKSGKLKYFSYYCFGVGFLAVVLYIVR